MSRSVRRCSWCDREIIGTRAWHKGQPVWRLHRSNKSNAKYCRPCRDRMDDLQKAAHKIVGDAVRHGDMPRAAECSCVDCGKAASHYDHRDYRKPLCVDAVCVGCNLRRGPAINPMREGTA